jgi:hypothetical protein
MARKLARRGKVRSSSAGKASRGRAARKTRRPVKAKRRAVGRQAKAKRSPKKAARKTARKPASKVVVTKRSAATSPAKKSPEKKSPEKKKTAVAPTAVLASRHAPSLDRSRRRLPEVEDNIPTPPSSLDMDRTPTAARSGRQASLAARAQHNETGPELTGGDPDADWEDAYAVGDEAPGGDNPTPDQDRVDDIGRALGVEYQDNEELKGSDKITGRDKHRWELDPASAEDYNDRDVED